LKVNGQQFRNTTAIVDGEHWRLRDRNELTLPPGQHRVVVTSQRHTSIFDRGFVSALQIKDSTAELTRISASERGLRCVASSPRRAWITVSREPSLVLLDGRPNPNPMIRRTRGEWIIQIPAGRHDLEIEDHTTFSAAVDLVSFESSTWIVVAGGSATVLLFLGYLAVRIRRLLTSGFRTKASAAPIE
jgi:hypothetical protein